MLEEIIILIIIIVIVIVIILGMLYCSPGYALKFFHTGKTTRYWTAFLFNPKTFQQRAEKI